MNEILRSFFEQKGIEWHDSYPLIAKDSKTVPFCISGGVPFESEIGGLKPQTKRFIASLQICLRTTNLTKIGYSVRHHICFPMLGHFMLGKSDSIVTKKLMINTAFEFLKSFGINIDKLAVTADVDDKITQKIWKDLGVKVFLDQDKKVTDATENYHGYQTEILIGDFGGCLESYKEIWNIVFYEFKDSKYTIPLSNIFADSGMSFDRLITEKEGCNTDYENSLWKPFLDNINLKTTDPLACRLGEYVKAVAYLVNEKDFYPANKGPGYEFRKLIRRMFIFSQEMGRDCIEMVQKSIQYYNLIVDVEKIIQEISRYRSVIVRNYAKCKRELKSITDLDEYSKKMHETYGFPRSLVLELKQKGEIKWIESLIN